MIVLSQKRGLKAPPIIAACVAGCQYGPVDIPSDAGKLESLMEHGIRRQPSVCNEGPAGGKTSGTPPSNHRGRPLDRVFRHRRRSRLGRVAVPRDRSRHVGRQIELRDGGQRGGQVVGYSATASGDSHAFLYSNDRMTDLGTLGGKGDSAAYGINDAGQVVGTASTAGGAYHAFLYNGKGPLADLGTTAGCTNSLATAINANGQIVGYAYTLTGGGGGIILVMGTASLGGRERTMFAVLDAPRGRAETPGPRPLRRWPRTVGRIASARRGKSWAARGARPSLSAARAALPLPRRKDVRAAHPRRRQQLRDEHQRERPGGRQRRRPERPQPRLPLSGREHG